MAGASPAGLAQRASFSPDRIGKLAGQKAEITISSAAQEQRSSAQER